MCSLILKYQRFTKRNTRNRTIANPRNGIRINAGIRSKVVTVRHAGGKRESTTFEKHELIGTHTARKTFACISYELGVRPEDIATLMGVDVRTLKSYLEIGADQAAESMKEKFKGFM